MEHLRTYLFTKKSVLDIERLLHRLSRHTGTSVLLYLQESFTFRVLSPEAAVPLTYARQG